MKFLAIICAIGLYSVQGLKMRDGINEHEFLWWGNSDSSSNQNNRGGNGYNNYNRPGILPISHAKADTEAHELHSSKKGGSRGFSNTFSSFRTSHQQTQTQPTQGQADQQNNQGKQDDSSASSQHSSWLQGWEKYEQNGQAKRYQSNGAQIQPQTQSQSPQPQTTQPTLVNPIPIPPTSNTLWAGQSHGKTSLRTHQINSSVSSSSR